MFRKSIESTPLTTEAANIYFQDGDIQITGQPFGRDNSVLATLRALIAPRMQSGDRLNVQFCYGSYSASDVAGAVEETIVRSVCEEFYPEEAEGQIVFYNLRGDKDGNKGCFDAIRNKFCEVYPGYTRLEKISYFYGRSFQVDCYINPEKKSVILFVDNLSNIKLHYLQVSTIALFPWYFSQETGVSERELDLSYSLQNATSDEYERLIAEFAKQYDFRTPAIKRMLGGFETRFDQMQLDQKKNEAQTIDQRIDQLNTQIGDYLIKRSDLLTYILGLERKIQDGSEESEIMDYFLRNKNLDLISVTDNEMTFVVRGYLDFFDQEVAERTIHNRNSIAYANYEGGISKDDMELLYNEIFLSDDPKLHIRICAAYRFRIPGSVRGIEGYNFGPEHSTYIPNTHINNYHCLGSYERIINQALKEYDYVRALEQCSASCRNLNWSDMTVLEKFLRQFWSGSGVNNCCVELPDGSVVKPTEAIRWLKEQDHGEEKEEA